MQLSRTKSQGKLKKLHEKEFDSHIPADFVVGLKEMRKTSVEEEHRWRIALALVDPVLVIL